MALRSRRAFARTVLAGLVALACDGPVELLDAGSDRGGPPGADGGRVEPPDAGLGVTFDPFARLADPYLPARTLPGRMRLASSRMPEPPEGTHNDDFNNYLRIDGTARMLVEADGPGVVTRIWLTGREPATQDYTVLDRTVLHVEIDGAEIVWPGLDRTGISLEELTSGSIPGFPRPWVAGRDLASNGFVVTVPIAFAESLRIWIDEPPGEGTFVYYQIDWRELPAGTTVEPFAGVPSEAHVAGLEAATALWIERSAAMSIAMDERVLGPGESAVLALNEPATVRAIAVETTSGELGALEAALVVDGETVVDGPLIRWTFAAPPTGPSESALASVAANAVVLRYPFPVRASAELALRNAGAGPIAVRYAFEHDPGDPDPDLGSLRISCGAPRTPEVGRNARLVDLAGRRGHYAGQFLIVRSGVAGFWSGLWVLEGDHEIETDGEWLLGTGMEDYFGGAFYYLRGPFALPLSGATYRSDGSEAYPRTSQYRHHLLDTIPFERSFRFEYESFVADSELTHCIYWYEAS
ncbi:MAG TPA: DUF2961 domain-containing protein [Sandaracinaceae bacterium]